VDFKTVNFVGKEKLHDSVILLHVTLFPLFYLITIQVVDFKNTRQIVQRLMNQA